MLSNEGDRLTRVVVSTPSEEYFRVTDMTAQNINEVADPRKTCQQFTCLKSTMEHFGCEVIEIPELTGHPNSVFTRDTAVSTPGGYITLRMGLEARRGEEEWMAQILESLGEPCAGQIRRPGTVEGGDILLAGSVAFVGCSIRTNKEGVKQLSVLLENMDYEVRTVNVRGSLHLGGMMSAIGPKRLLCLRGKFPSDFFEGFDVIDVDCTGSCNGNVICLGENEVIANSAENMKVVRILEHHGVKVHAMDLSEFRKGGGGPSCLVLPIERKQTAQGYSFFVESKKV